MKTDISHLPEDKQEELREVVRLIREAVDPEMVILFGSHARGDWVEDEETGYDPDYSITREELEHLGARVRELWSLTEESCRGKIERLSGRAGGGA